MNEGMKRLLKCDSSCLFRNVRHMAGGAVLLVAWFWITCGKVINITVVAMLLMGLLIVTNGVSDWTNQIRTYIGMGITRKSTFVVLFIRGLLEVFLGLLLEILISAVFYREYLKAEVLAVSLFVLLFCNGWGQFSGIAGFYWKYGKAVQVIGYTIIGGIMGFSFMMAMYNNVLDEIIKWIDQPFLLGLGAVCCIVWLGGTLWAYGQLKKFTVV